MTFKSPLRAIPGYRLIHELPRMGGTEANWWDPNNEGLPVVGAYRAINSAGTPWAGGPTSYAESLVNQANLGTNDLTETNGALTWAQAVGWSFVAAQSKALNTGISPTTNYTVIAEFANASVAIGYLIGQSPGGVVARMLGIGPSQGSGQALYVSGSVIGVAPNLVTGNLCAAHTQAYRNGVAEGAAMAGVGVGATSPLWIGVRNDGAARFGWVTAETRAVAIYSAQLTPAQVSAVDIAMGQL